VEGAVMTAREEIHGAKPQALTCREDGGCGERTLESRRLKEDDIVDRLQQVMRTQWKNATNLPT
jgi:hypothetical protein